MKLKMYLLSLLSFFVLIAIVVFSGVSLEINQILLKSWIRWLGLGVFAFGYLMRLLSWLTSSKYDIRDFAQEELPKTGIYQFVRHPKLWGSALMYLGLSIGVCSVVGVALTILIIGPLTLFRIKNYEKSLLDLLDYQLSNVHFK